MRWLINKNKKSNKPKKQYNEGDCKIKVKFAFLPIKINNNVVWMERYIEIYEYKKRYI